MSTIVALFALLVGLVAISLGHSIDGVLWLILARLWMDENL